jgi:hypothetical protein
MVSLSNHEVRAAPNSAGPFFPGTFSSRAPLPREAVPPPRLASMRHTG